MGLGRADRADDLVDVLVGDARARQDDEPARGVLRELAQALKTSASIIASSSSL